MATLKEKVVVCLALLLAGFIAANFMFHLAPHLWLPAFLAGGIVGFTICYIVNCIKRRA